MLYFVLISYSLLKQGRKGVRYTIFFLLIIVIIILSFVVGIYNAGIVKINLLVVNLDVRLSSLIISLLGVGCLIGVIISLFLLRKSKTSTTSSHSLQ